MAAKRKSKGAYMISAVAEMYEIHPQTLRLYEREGLLKPSRTEGNTRLYTDEDLERLEFILNLARDLGVNIAGIAIILQMRERMEEMNRQMQSFVEYVRSEMLTRFQQAAPGRRGDCSHSQAGGGYASGRAAQAVVRYLLPFRRVRLHSILKRPDGWTRPGRVCLYLHAARFAWIGRLRPGDLYGVCRHGAGGGARLSARTAAGAGHACGRGRGIRRR